MPVKQLGKTLCKAIVSWWERDAFTQSAAIAYYTIFSFPALVIIYFAGASLFVEQEQTQAQVYRFLTDSFGAESSLQFQKIIERSAPEDTNIWAFVIGGSVLVFTGLKLFMQLQRALNLVWEVDNSQFSAVKKLVLRRISSFGVMLSIGFILVVSMVATSTLSVLTDKMIRLLPDYLAFLLHVVNVTVSLSIVTLTLGLMMKKLPDAYVSWKNAFSGGALAAILFVIGEYALGLYFGVAEPSSAYGVTGSIILLMLWVFYSCVIFLLGAEFSKELQISALPDEDPAHHPKPVSIQ